MPQAVYILFGAVFTAATGLAAGLLLLRSIGAKLYRQEIYPLAFVTGSTLLSLLVFVLAACGLARKGVFLAVGLAVLVFAIRAGVFRRTGERFAPLPRVWLWVLAAFFLVFGNLYFFNAMAPEASPDGASYHLGIVARYLRERGIVSIPTNMYAGLSQGIEMLFMFAFAFGRHSAAALVHLAFLWALALLMLSYARRKCLPAAGVIGTALVFASPVVGRTATTAYIDVALAAVLFALYYWLEVWDEEGGRAAIAPIGLLAGFAFASKFTAFTAVPYALGFLLLRSVRTRRLVLRPLLLATLLATVMIAPWLGKNYLTLGNPFGPFLNRLFPNPNNHIAFEQEYSARLRDYDAIKSWTQIPVEAALRGGTLQGMTGPAFLLAPLALLGLARRTVRRLLLAALVFALPYPANIGTRFLIPCLPFLGLALGIVLAGSRIALPTLLILGYLSYPTALRMYANPYAWRLGRVPVKPALRIIPEEHYLTQNLPGYVIARMVEDNVPKGGRVFAFQQIPDAYCSREILVGYQGGLNNTLGEMLWSPFIAHYQPSWRLKFRFPPQRLLAVRAITASSSSQLQFAVSEVRVFRGGRELPRASWVTRADPNPWDARWASDGTCATRWRAWEHAEPGMWLEVRFRTPEDADELELQTTPDQQLIKIKLEGQLTSGEWRVLADSPEQSEVPDGGSLRRDAAGEMKSLGIRYLLVNDPDPWSEDFRTHRAEWGITELIERGGTRLYRFD